MAIIASAVTHVCQKKTEIVHSIVTNITIRL